MQWPVEIRVPVRGELLSLPDGDQVEVRHVQWWLDDPDADPTAGRVSVQLIV